MTKKCPTKNCNNDMIEVRKAEFFSGDKKKHSIYPKEQGDMVYGKVWREYRFACPYCKKEWIYDSLRRWFEPVDSKSEYKFSWKKNILVFRKKKLI